VDKLTVSVPIEMVYNFEFSTVCKLKERIKTLSPLPQGIPPSPSG
jgi:hypothetical protein